MGFSFKIQSSTCDFQSKFKVVLAIVYEFHPQKIFLVLRFFIYICGNVLYKHLNFTNYVQKNDYLRGYRAYGFGLRQ